MLPNFFNLIQNYLTFKQTSLQILQNQNGKVNRIHFISENINWSVNWNKFGLTRHKSGGRTKVVTWMKSLYLTFGVIVIGLAMFSYAEAWGGDWKFYSETDLFIS